MAPRRGASLPAPAPAVGLALLAAVLGGGLDAGLTLGVSSLAWIVPLVLAAVAVSLVIGSRSRSFRRLTAGLGRGCSSLKGTGFLRSDRDAVAAAEPPAADP